jgi:hypothetical protein
MPVEVTAIQGSAWVKRGESAILQVPSATMSLAGFNYIINPNHPDFSKLEFAFVELRFDKRLRPRIGPRSGQRPAFYFTSGTLRAPQLGGAGSVVNRCTGFNANNRNPSSTAFSNCASLPAI